MTKSITHGDVNDLGVVGYLYAFAASSTTSACLEGTECAMAAIQFQNMYRTRYSKTSIARLHCKGLCGQVPFNPINSRQNKSDHIPSDRVHCIV